MNSPENIELVPIKLTDATLREGDQAPFTSFIREEKAIIAAMLKEIGINTIESGFAASPAEKENQNIAGAIDAIGDNSSTFISSLGMAVSNNTDDSIEALSDAKNQRIHIFIATPDDHINKKFPGFGKTIEERREKVIEHATDQIKKVVNHKNKNNLNIEIEISAEAATNNSINELKVIDFETEEFKFLVRWIREVIKAGANIVNIPDTLGNLLPWESEKLFKKLVEETEDLKDNFNFEFSCHVHNDLASATSGALSAVRGGARQIELTINGIGERTGNTPLHEIVGIITEKPYSIIDGKKVTLPNIQTQLIGPVSRFVDTILNLNKKLLEPFIGALSTIDGSGVHNAAPDVYGGSKDNAKYGKEEIEGFFSPRGGRNQISEILREYGIKENPKSEIITNITNKACVNAETTKALYYSNIYALYLEEKGFFKIEDKDINVSGDGVNIKFKLYGKNIEIIGKGEDDQGFIDGTIEGINNYLGNNMVDVDDIISVNKPSLRQAIDKFYEDVSKTTFELSHEFKLKIDNIIGENGNGKYSKQKGVSNVKMIVGGRKMSSVSFGHDVTKNNIKAIIYGALPELIKKISIDELMKH